DSPRDTDESPVSTHAEAHMDAGAWIAIGAAVTGLLSAAATYLVKRVNDKDIASLSKRLLSVELAEEECQQRNRMSEAKLLAASERERMLRETLPKKMVEDVSELLQESRRQTEESKRQTEEQVKQTQHLENQTLSLKKLDAWDSDPGNKFKRDLDEIKALAIAMGLKVENIDRVIDRLQPDRDTPKVTLEVVNQQDTPDHQEVKDSDNNH